MNYDIIKVSKEGKRVIFYRGIIMWEYIAALLVAITGLVSAI
jgi:hypothetical protein